MTLFSHTNWYIAVTSSAANIPPQRRQPIVFVPSSGFGIWTGLPCMVCHAVILVQSVQAKVNPIHVFWRIGLGRSSLWELSGVVCRNRPIGMGHGSGEGSMGDRSGARNYVGKNREGAAIVIIPRGDTGPHSVPGLHWS